MNLELVCNIIIKKMDVLGCVNRIQNDVFSLDEMYAFESELKFAHPLNNSIKPIIRQQLQFLRDRGFVELLGNGLYRKAD